MLVVGEVAEAWVGKWKNEFLSAEGSRVALAQRLRKMLLILSLRALRSANACGSAEQIFFRLYPGFLRHPGLLPVVPQTARHSAFGCRL